jgi:hypothetical protein
MSLIQEALDQRPPAGISLRERAAVGFGSARQAALELLDKRPTAGLSPRQWAEMGLESAQKAVQEVEQLVGQ